MSVVFIHRAFRLMFFFARHMFSVSLKTLYELYVQQHKQQKQTAIKKKAKNTSSKKNVMIIIKSLSYPTEERDRIRTLLEAKQNYKYAHVKMGEPKVKALRIHNLQHISSENRNKSSMRRRKKK